MSGTLVWRRRGSAEMGQIFEPCATGCLSRIGSAQISGLARSSATVQAIIMGRGDVFLCDRCRREWDEAWVECGGDPVRPPREKGALRAVRPTAKNTLREAA